MEIHRFLTYSQKTLPVLCLNHKIISAQTEERGILYGKLKAVINKYWKVYVAALIIAAVCDLIGTLKFNIGIGTLTLFPMVFATIFGGLLGPDAFKLFKTEESKLGGSLVLVALAPFMAKWESQQAEILQNWLL